MSFTRTYRCAAIFITALFLLLQGANLSHAASHGQGPHEHDGIICVLSLQDEADLVMPAPQVTVLGPAEDNTARVEYETAFMSAPAKHYRGREPPPRGPPSL